MNVTDENGDLVIDEYGDPVPPQLYELPDAPFESPNTYGSRINDNGDILGKIFINDGTPMLAYLYNPGLDGQQIVGPTDLRVFNSAFQFNYTGIQMNHPDPEAGRDLQIAGSLQSPSGESVAFRYTLGGALDVLDPFEDANGNMIRLSTVGDINESGTYLGNAEVLFPKKIKGQASTSALYRFGTTEEMFDWKYRESATAINDAGDLVALR